jgi:RuvB-like protein 2
MSVGALQLLTKMASETSLRYAIQMITTAALVATKRKATQVDLPDLKRVWDLFVDVKRSTQFLNELSEKFLFSESAMKD